MTAKSHLWDALGLHRAAGGAEALPGVDTAHLRPQRPSTAVGRMLILAGPFALARDHRCRCRLSGEGSSTRSVYQVMARSKLADAGGCRIGHG
jgi:hypothetical protein